MCNNNLQHTAVPNLTKPSSYETFSMKMEETIYFNSEKRWKMLKNDWKQLKAREMMKND
jgi:hypothetical protein